jgi:hypothetical protein
LEATQSKLQSLEAIEEATRAAEERRAHLLNETLAEADRTAAEVVDDARRQGELLLEEARREAARVVAAAHQKRMGLVGDLARERSVFEETRTRLSGFLADTLENIGAASTTDERPANVRELDEARATRTSARADR